MFTHAINGRAGGTSAAEGSPFRPPPFARPAANPNDNNRSVLTPDGRHSVESPRFAPKPTTNSPQPRRILPPWPSPSIRHRTAHPTQIEEGPKVASSRDSAEVIARALDLDRLDEDETWSP